MAIQLGLSLMIDNNSMSQATMKTGQAIKVIHFIHSVAYGGVETILLNWVKAMKETPIEAHLVCFENPGQTERPFKEAAERAGIKVRTIPWSRRKPILRCARQLRNIINEVGADILHTHNVYADLVGLVAARQARIKILSTVYVWSNFHWRRNLLQRINQWALYFFDLATAQCETTRQDMIARGMSAPHIQVLVSGFDATNVRLNPDERQQRRQQLGIDDDTVLLANVARFYPEKAQAKLLRLFKTIHSRHPDSRLWMFGKGPLEEELRQLCQQLGLENAVRFVGFAADIDIQLQLVDIQVHPSFAEGIPLAVCSGMSAGLPLIASSVGGIPEVIEHEQTGLLIPSAADEAFAEAFISHTERLIEDSALRSRLGQAARQFICNDYSLETAMTGLYQTYQSLLKP